MKGRVVGDVALLMSERDTVATVLEDLEAGRTLPFDGETIALREDVLFGHKVATKPIGAGERIYKYGEVIGEATEDVEAGEWVHTHNCRSLRAQPAEATEDSGVASGSSDGGECS